MGTKTYKYRMTVFDLYMNLILIMPITTLIQNKIDFINRILFIGIFAMQMLVLFKYKLTKNRVLLLFAALSVYIIGIFNTENLSFDNKIVYYINWIIYSNIIILNKERFKNWILKSKALIYAVVWLWTITVFCSIFLPSSYYIKEGGGRYFGSFAGSIFRLGPTALFIAILSLVIIVAYEDRKAITFNIIPLYCGFMGSSRTYFVIIALVALIGIYFFSKNRKQFCCLLILCSIIGIIAFGNSSMSQKILYTTDADQYGDFWFRITSSRSIIWTKILEQFKQLSIFKQIFGGGYGFSSRVAGHYAHNDFIEILATHGFTGLAIYFISIIGLLKCYLKKGKLRCVNMICIIIWAFNAMFNMFYYYTCAALSFPILLLVIELYIEKKKHYVKLA